MKKYNVMALLTKPTGMAVVAGIVCVTAVLAGQQPESYSQKTLVAPSCGGINDSGSCVYTTYAEPLYRCVSCWFYNCGCTCTNVVSNSATTYEGVCVPQYHMPVPPSTNWLFLGYECESMKITSSNVATLTTLCYNPNN